MLKRLKRTSAVAGAVYSAVMLAITPPPSVKEIQVRAKTERKARREDCADSSQRAKRGHIPQKNGPPQKTDLDALMEQEERRKWDDLKYKIICMFMDHSPGERGGGELWNPAGGIVQTQTLGVRPGIPLYFRVRLTI